jgi:outer membrane receptor protein involved in Fe transport
MKFNSTKQQVKSLVALLFGCFLSTSLLAQMTIKGKILDGGTGEMLVGATAIVKGTTVGAQSDFDGIFEFVTSTKPPFTLQVSFIGYESVELDITSETKFPLSIKIGSETKTIDVVEIKGQRISDKQKAAPLTVESMDRLAIKQTAALSFYEGMGNLKGVDLTTASIGFTIINTRGFNSTSPVRSLQIIDGVDNQAPGLNFSLGNFLGSSELDVNKVDLVVGASSAFYGPNAFNGVISMETKNPFFQRGLAGSFKVGERNLTEAAFRFADSYKNKAGHAWMAFKLNGFFLKAYDWVADNYDPVFGTETGTDNPGRFDAVNIYGDEYNASFDQRLNGVAPLFNIGLRSYHRTGYKEIDLVDYNTKNIKANAALHFRLNPSQAEQSPELIISSNFGSGTTVYQGDNRFSLRDILFFQNRIEIKKRDKFFIRAYATNEDAGNSYDPYFTALVLQQKLRSNSVWAAEYEKYWRDYVDNQAKRLGYPEFKLIINPDGSFTRFFDTTAALAWLKNPVYIDSMFAWHRFAESVANGGVSSKDFLIPGSDNFRSNFEKVTQTKSNKRSYNDPNVGTQFYDKSALYHVAGEYRFQPKKYLDEIVVGANVRLYRPISDGTIFYDTIGAPRITNNEFGSFAGIERKFNDKKWKFNATLRMDKNQNFDLLFSPAASLVWQPNNKDYARLSFSSAIRNPTLTDQYLFLNVGRAILAGNLNGAKNLITVESFRDWLGSLDKTKLRRFDVAPIQPEKVKSFEIGYRSTFWENTFVDASYYFSFYDNFIGYQIGITADSSQGFLRDVQAYRYAANSLNTVTTQGFSFGFNHYFKKFFQFSGNYSWNVLNTKLDDPIIPAFNTPEHKFNFGISGRDVEIGKLKNIGFAINYKWIQGFIFEGSPQFTGSIPTYDLLDGQISYHIPKLNLTFKAGGSNLLNKLQFQTYGGPRIGRMAYISILYDWVKK